MANCCRNLPEPEIVETAANVTVVIHNGRANTDTIRTTTTENGAKNSQLKDEVRPDSSIPQALIRCDSTGRARLEEIRTLRESSRVQQTLTMTSPAQPYQPTVLTVKSVVDSMGIYLTFKERHCEEQQVRTIETVIEKEGKVLISLFRQR